jgi:hypothetical protein
VGAKRATPEAVRPNRPSGERGDLPVADVRRPSADVAGSLGLRDKDLYLDDGHPPGEKADVARKPHDSPGNRLRADKPHDSRLNRLKEEFDSQSPDSRSYSPPSMQHPLPPTGKGPDVIEETHETHETHDMAHEKREEAEPRCHFNAETGLCESYDYK